LSFPNFRNLTRSAIPIKQPMSIERATHDLPIAYTPAETTGANGGADAQQRADETAYPPAPSDSACGALVPCRHASQGCPLGVDVPGLARAVAGGDHEAAFRIVRAAHPFASTCGNGCHAPCESACRRRPFGAPVAIGALEEHAATFAMPDLVAPSGPCTSRFEARSVAGAVGRAAEAAPTATRSPKRIAVIGAGPAGLACAHDLALLGHRPVVYEARPEPGGLMTGGLPAFRFPTASAREECSAVVALGVEFRGLAGVGSLRSLLEAGAQAVFVAVGASRPGASLLESVQHHPDIFDAMDVLCTDVGAMGRTIVAGEGPLAIDAARTLARRAGGAGTTASSVELVLTTPLGPTGVAPELLASCAREGIRVHHEWRVRRAHVDPESGLLTSIDVAAPDGTSSRVLPCDRLILAPARAPDLAFLTGDVHLTRSGFVATDPQTLRTSMPNVWAGGACAFGHRSIAHAVADGKRAAWEIHGALTGQRVSTTFASAWVEANGRPRPDRGAAERRRSLPLLDAPPADPFAPVTPRAATRAGEEAARCFDCARIPVVTGECTKCHQCAETCPPGAIALIDDRPVVEADICNRCGVCIEACPEGALTMLRAEWEERLRFESSPFDANYSVRAAASGNTESRPLA
jgi:NADPH-dependent glutamate synthase beta subunit-like oxidoreductase